MSGVTDSTMPLKLPKRIEVGTLRFRGKRIPYCEGDTIASALFAAGVRIVSRSFKYHRPRGFYDLHGFGADSLVNVDGEPNVPADRRPASNGMQVETQNAWPSVDLDVMAVNDLAVPLLPNGFYYKLFHKPRWAWPFFEQILRRAAGHGQIGSATGNRKDEKARYEKRYRFPELCVIGGGPAGLATALAAANEGKRVLLIDRMAELGGHAVTDIEEVRLCEAHSLDGMRGCDAVVELIRSVEEHDRIEVQKNLNVFAVYEDNYIAAENGRDLFKIRAEDVVVANGASDRHLVFDRNDLPGVMTARAVERLIAVHGIAPGRRAVVVTCHDGGYRTAQILRGAGVEVAAIVDARKEAPAQQLLDDVKQNGSTMISNQTIHRALGRRRVKGVVIGDVMGAVAGEGKNGSTQKFSCDLIVMAVGFSPQLGLLSMGRGRPNWDPERGVFRIQDLPKGLYASGELNGSAGFGRLYNEGSAMGRSVALGLEAHPSERAVDERICSLPADIDGGGSKHIVCRCMDVTRKEMQASIAEGYDQIETLKRYSSMGMGRCQGKTCYEAVARLTGIDTGRDTSSECRSVPTTFRPPFSPVSFGVLAGRAPHLPPTRRTAMHDLHVQAGATFLLAGQWLRPETFTTTDEEVMAVRTSLGITDVSTLGKLELSGPDAMAFLHFMLPGKFAKLEVGRVRYLIMVNEDGILFDDGTIAHIAKGRFLISTTTGNAASILRRFRWWVTTNHFDIRLRDLSAGLAAVNVAGPNARKCLSKTVEIDLSNDSFPYMSVREASIEGVPVRLFRIGFTGELSYEIHFPAEYGEDMWKTLLERGEAFGIRPFGVESQRVLRLEKGHLIPGTDTDALSNPYEAGVGFGVNEKKPDFIGRAFLASLKERGIENRLIAYKLKPGDPIPEDGVVILHDGKIIGRVTSSRLSPTLGHGVGLGWVTADRSSPGQEIEIRLGSGQPVRGEILDGHGAYDPNGERLKS